MDWRLDFLVELFIQIEVDVEVHHLQIPIDLSIDQRQIFFDDLRLNSTIFEKRVNKVFVTYILLSLNKFIVGCIQLFLELI